MSAALLTTIGNDWVIVGPMLLVSFSSALVALQARSHSTVETAVLSGAAALLKALEIQTRPKSADPSAGGGSTPTATDAYLPLSELARWSQTTAVLPDGSLDPQAYNDCGETCVAAIVAGTHGVAVSPGSVRANNGGTGRSGLTTGADLVQMLAYYNVAAVCDAPTKAELRSYVAAATARGNPTIVLGVWPNPGGSLHWMTTTGAGAKWQVMNPWGGHIEEYDWATVESLYAGCVVMATGHLHYDMSGRSIAA